LIETPEVEPAFTLYGYEGCRHDAGGKTTYSKKNHKYFKTQANINKQNIYIFANIMNIISKHFLLQVSMCNQF